jgi:hypothetical protein
MILLCGFSLIFVTLSTFLAEAHEPHGDCPRHNVNDGRDFIFGNDTDNTNCDGTTDSDGDSIELYDAQDRTQGAAGDDWIRGDKKGDTLNGGSDPDNLIAGNGNDTVTDPQTGDHDEVCDNDGDDYVSTIDSDIDDDLYAAMDAHDDLLIGDNGDDFVPGGCPFSQ